MFCPFCMKQTESEICPHCGSHTAVSNDVTHLSVGYALQGKHSYVLGATRGQGGFGITYIALDMVTNRRVAVKEYFPTYCSSRLGGTVVSAYHGQEEAYQKGKERFLDEARMLKSLSDLKSVVNVLDFFEANNSAYLVMEYLDGLSLKDFVQQQGKLPARQFLDQLKPLMADMEKMHRRGVVHRDIAPDNIIMMPDGRLKLIDFGAARSYVGDKSMTVVVKKGFAPVEQYMRKGSNASTDVYALAATIYYCITGIVPPDSAERQYGEALLQAPSVLGADILPHQERALEQALEIQPKDRTQSIGEFMAALEQERKPVQRSEKAAAPKPAEKSIPTEKQKKKVIWWIPAVAAVLVLCIGVGIFFAGKGTAPVPESVEEPEGNQIADPETQPTGVLSPEAVKYNEAVDFFKNGEYGKSAIAFAKLGDYRDAKEISRKIWDAIAVRRTISTGDTSAVAIKNDGTVIAAAYDQRERLSEWDNIVSVSTASNMDAVGLKSDGTVILDHTDSYHPIDISDWHDIVSVSISGRHVVGLKADGTVVAAGWNQEKDGTHIGQCDVSDWTDIIAVEAGNGFTVALKADGTVIKTGYDILNVYEITKWTDIVAVDAGLNHIVALKSDGTVMATGWDSAGECDVSDWTDIIAIHAGSYHTLGIKSDGTVVSAGHKGEKSYQVADWNDITAVATGWNILAGLRADGTVVTAGRNRDVIKNWADIMLPADREKLLSEIRLAYITEEEPPEQLPPMDPNAETYNEAVDFFKNGEYGKAAIAFAKLGDYRDAKEISRKIWDAIAEREIISANRWHTVGLRSDGTVVATGKNAYDMCKLDDWTDIVAVSAGEYHTVGLKSDGTVVAKGKPGADWVELSDWTDVVAINAGIDVTLGIRADGTVLVAGFQEESAIREIAGLQDVVGICYDQGLYAARKSDGTVVSNYDISDWEDVAQISTTEHGWLVRLMADGSVSVDAQEDWMLTESLDGKKVDVTQWSGITSVSAGWGHILGIKPDGTVIATGGNNSKQCEVGDWTDIVAVSCGQLHSVGLKSDGTTVSCGSGVGGMRDTKNWADIKVPVDRELLLSDIKPEYIVY